MTIEEKAKAYDEALERARTWKEKSGMPKDRQGILDNIFPELSESEDERIRKELISFLQLPHPQFIGERKQKKWIAWLEKQNEQKDYVAYFKAKDWYVSKVDGKIHNIYHSVVKAEPKFHEGDWIVSDKNNVVRIKSIDSNYYVLENTMRFTIDYVDKCWHLWSIQDAKDGDVLAGNYGTFIFIGENDGYCGILSDNSFIRSTRNNEWTECLHPATKEQQDLLFQKMREAGYEWDAEKKKLKKIEQKPVWSEEDEKMLADACIMLDWYKGNNWWTAQCIKDWLKSLKQRIRE